MIIERADDAIRLLRLAVDDACLCGWRRGQGIGVDAIDGGEVGCGVLAIIVLRPLQSLASGLLPYLHEDALQRVDLVAFYAAVHVAPRAHLLRAIDVVVGNVHATGIGNLSVDDDDFAVVAAEDVVNPREVQRVELVDLDALAAQFADMAVLQRSVVGGVAESIVECSHLYALCRLLGQQVEEQHGDGVVAEVEILQVDAAARFADGLEHVVELLLSADEQSDAVVMGEGHPFLPQLFHDDGVGRRLCHRLSQRRRANQREQKE